MPQPCWTSWRKRRRTSIARAASVLSQVQKTAQLTAMLCCEVLPWYPAIAEALASLPAANWTVFQSQQAGSSTHVRRQVASKFVDELTIRTRCLIRDNPNSETKAGPMCSSRRGSILPVIC
jgi:hypothetical protein